MKTLLTTLCLTIAVLLGSANAQTGSTRDPLILTLVKDGRIFLNENLVSLEHLVSSLIAIRSSNPEKVSMYFRVDQAATYSQMQIVMKAMKQAGFVRGKIVGGRGGMPIIWLIEYTPPMT
jgi:biopolymer transport protein ExbD